MDSRIGVIRAAIAERRLLEFRYHRLLRIVLPLRLGLAGPGDWKLRAIQVGGDSSSGGQGRDIPKLFDVSKITDLALRDSGFEVPEGYQRGDSAFRLIDTEL